MGPGGFDADDVKTLYILSSSLLYRLIYHEDSKELQDWVDHINLRIDTEQALSRADHLFAQLGRLPGSKRLRAEAAYGYACLRAIKDDADAASKQLLEAQRMAGENTCGYLNRALLDKDFNTVRSRPEFEALWSQRPPHAPVQGPDFSRVQANV